MAGLIEDYAIVGDTRTVALISREGSVDWWCAPRIDSGACFSALLGTAYNGCWRLCPAGDQVQTTRKYITDTLVLETTHVTPSGTVVVKDFMVPASRTPTIHRIVDCISGSAEMELELIVRFDYGSIVPWVQSSGDGITLVAGRDGLRFHSPVELSGHDFETTANFTMSAGSSKSFSIAWFDSADDPPIPHDSLAVLRRTERYWCNWVSQCTYEGGWRDDVVRSLITLKALTYEPSGAMVAAATTSLPEEIGGVRNWDYRYSWLRDATLTLQALLISGYKSEATAWSRWLRRAVAGSPGEFQIMYGIRGERRLTELELDWLPGYEGSQPVRTGNAASEQFQLDVFGEVLDAALTARRGGISDEEGYGVDIITALMLHLEKVWSEPDEGIWEVRGPRQHFTHSKMMAWVAFDRVIRLMRFENLDGPHRERWEAIRDQIHAEVCEEGWNPRVGAFTQYYGSDRLDSSLLMMAPVGFLPPDDHRIISTIEAIQERLTEDGFVKRYETDGDSTDGLSGDEGVFLLTTFWLADNLALIGRREEAVELYNKLLDLRNDVGLLSEEYDPTAGRLLGNFPQAFSHMGVIHTAANLSSAGVSPCEERAMRD